MFVGHQQGLFQLSDLFSVESLIIFGLLTLFSLSCSLTQCSGQSGVSSNNTDIPSQEPTQAKVTPEATQEEIHPGYILHSDTGGLYFFDLQTSQSSRLVAGNIRSGSISPDGLYLAYLTDSDDPDSWKTSDLSVLVLETGELLNTSGFPEDANTYIWSKEPGVITFTRRNWDYCLEFVDHQITGLYQYNVLTNETSTLYIGTDQYVFWLEEWSPDGRYLLFSHGPDCSEGRLLMYYDVQTGAVDGVPFAEASWSPDRNYLAANGIWYWEPEDLPLIQYHISTGEAVELFFEPGRYVSSPVLFGRRMANGSLLYFPHLSILIPNLYF